MARALFLYVFFVALLCTIILVAGPVPQWAFGHDSFAILEGGWKITHGYRPYLDFHTLMGPLTHLIMALGICITGPVAEALPVSILVTLIPVAILAWYVLSSRLTPLGTFVGAAYLAMLWSGPYPLHFNYWVDSYAMIYNRQSYVLLCLLLVSLAVNTRANPYLNGLLLGLLLFFKIPYFIAGAGLAIFYVIFTGISRKEMLRTLAGFLTVLIPVAIYLRGYAGLASMINVFYMAGKTRTPEVFEGSFILLRMEFTGAAILLFLISGFYVFSTVRISNHAALSNKNCFRLLVEPWAVLLASLFTEIGGCPLGYLTDIPLLCIYGIILFDRMSRHIPSSKLQLRYWPTVIGMSLCLIFVVPMWGRSFLGAANSVFVWIIPYQPSLAVIDGAGSRDLPINDSCGTYPLGIDYVDKVNDGIQLIRKHPELDHACIATLDFSDPFSFSLQRPSPPHMPLGIQWGINVNDTIAPDPARIFEGCEAIMIPKWPDSPENTVPILENKYRGYLSTHFAVSDESYLWVLLTRINAKPNGTTAAVQN
jgi:hypothetical protein